MTREPPSDAPASEIRPSERAAAGRCGSCRFGRTQRSAKGSLFWRCARADSDSAYGRYPPLPVQVCAGWERER